MWRHACSYFAWMNNVQVRSGESAFNKRFKGGHFKGNLLPFGCLLDFMTVPSVLGKEHPAEPRADPGILLGYAVNPGGQWSGDFYCSLFSSF